MVVEILEERWGSPFDEENLRNVQDLSKNLVYLMSENSNDACRDAGVHISVMLASHGEC